MIRARSTALTLAAAALTFGVLFAVARATDDPGAQGPPARPAAAPPLAVSVAPLGKAAPLPALRRPAIARAPTQARGGALPAPAPEPKPKLEPGEDGVETPTTTATTPVVPVPQPIEPPQPTVAPSPPQEEPSVTFDDSG
jgi:outer membrane biosynthesis protein TonB